MNISVFDVVGPVMIGPSSSHTAGAARLARVAAMVAGGPFSRVRFGLSGSFAKTHVGHGTSKALVAGALGFATDDERIVDAFDLAARRGLHYEFYVTDLEYLHENAVQMDFTLDSGKTVTVIGSSTGGGRILINSINGFETGFTAESSTLVIRQEDKKGVVSDVSHILAEGGINIGVMRLSRKQKGGVACCIIETDHEIPPAVVEQLRGVSGVQAVQALNIAAGEGC